MNVTFACPHCDLTSRLDFDQQTTELTCPHCQGKLKMPAGAVEGSSVFRCLICPSTELYVRKNFSQQLGVMIIGIGLVASCISWYYHMWYTTFSFLFGTALIDLAFYFVVGNLLQCYRCHAEYRHAEELEQYGQFNLEIHERYRQQAARLAEVPEKSTLTSTSDASH